MNKQSIYEYLAERDGLFCGICGATLAIEWFKYRWWLRARDLDIKRPFKRKRCGLTVDHIIPRSIYKPWEKGESAYANRDNLQLAHDDCNNKKGNTAPATQPMIELEERAGQLGTSCGP